MRFLSVKANNFLSFHKLEYDIPATGLFFIAGIVEGQEIVNSNGAGKSVIPEALCFGLFGQTLRDAGKDDIINWVANKNCFVEVEFFDNNEIRYRIQRFRNDEHLGNSLLFYKYDSSGAEKEITLGSARETQSLIESVLGMNWLVFSSAVVFGERAQRFVEARDSEKKEIFDEILLLQKFQEAQRFVRDDMKTIDEEITRIDVKIENCQAVKQTLQTNINRILEELKRISTIRISSEKQLELLTENFNKLGNNLKIEREILERTEKEFIAAEKENIAIYTCMRTTETDKSKALIDISAKTASVKALIFSISKKIDDVNQQINFSDKLTEGAQCSLCGQEITSFSKEEIFNHYQLELKKLVQEKTNYETDLKKNEHLYKIESDFWEKKFNDVVNLKTQLDDIIHEKSKVKSSLTVKISLMEKEALSLENQITSIKNELQFHEDALKSEKAHISGQLETKEKELTALNIEKQQFQTDREYYVFWERGFGNKGVKSFLLDEVLPILNEKVSYYGSVLLGENIVIRFDTQMALKSKDEVRDIFNIKLVHFDGRVVDYKLCSGGEKKRIDVAILLALQNLIYQRAMCQYNLVIFDELFDALDISGIENVAELLKDEAQKKAIFVISHSSEFKDFFENIWTVRKNNKGVSSLEI